MKVIEEWRKQDYESGKQEGMEKGMEKGIGEGIEKEKINTAKNMLKENYTLKQIAKITQLNIESIKQIKLGLGK